MLSLPSLLRASWLCRGKSVWDFLCYAKWRSLSVHGSEWQVGGRRPRKPALQEACVSHEGCRPRQVGRGWLDVEGHPTPDGVGAAQLFLRAESDLLGSFVEDMGDRIVSEIAVSSAWAHFDRGLDHTRGTVCPGQERGWKAVGTVRLYGRDRRPSQGEVSWVFPPIKLLLRGYGAIRGTSGPLGWRVPRCSVCVRVTLVGRVALILVSRKFSDAAAGLCLGSGRIALLELAWSGERGL